jgi:putative glutamine amidotransferase
VPPRPIIGIVAGTQDAVWSLGQPYVRAITEAGGLPWIVPPLSDDEASLRAIHQQLAGLFLPGGVDIDPCHYGESCHPLTERCDEARDAVELRLVHWALADHKPILGVCRGFQMLNVAGGGTLYQDVATQHPAPIKHDYFSAVLGLPRQHLAHAVTIKAASRLAQALGTEQCQVNSMHHQGIKRLAPGLVAVAFAPDGVIEGVEMPAERFVVGVQWHPEEMTGQHKPMRRLFAAFVAAAGDSMAKP